MGSGSGIQFGCSFWNGLFVAFRFVISLLWGHFTCSLGLYGIKEEPMKPRIYLS